MLDEISTRVVRNDGVSGTEQKNFRQRKLHTGKKQYVRSVLIMFEKCLRPNESFDKKRRNSKMWIGFDNEVRKKLT
jgi:hypothetical protein